MRDMTLTQIAELVDGEVVGEGDYRVTGVCSVKMPETSKLCFLHDVQLANFIVDSPAAVIVKPEFRDRITQGIVHDNPGRAYRLFAQQLAPKHVPQGVHTSATIADSANLASNVHVGANVVIGERVTIGENVSIGAGTVVEHDVTIGANTRVEANVTLCHGVQIGVDNVLRAGCVIGADGFGYHFDAGAWHYVPQLGKVVTGQGAEIGANTTVDRGAIEDTIIGHGVIIDNLVQIGHNVEIGEHTAIVGQAGIAGSTKVGKYCLIGGATVINGHIEICDNVQINGHSSVYKSITQAGAYSSVMPAMPVKTWLKLVGYFRRIGQLFKA